MALAGLLLLLLATAALLDPLGIREPTTSRPPIASDVTPPQRAGGEVRPEDHGAVGDGVADDTSALQAALDALDPNDVLVLPQGRVYRHDDVLRVTRPWSRITGPGRLLAGNEERSALRLEAEGAQLTGVELAITGTTRRWTGSDQHRLVLGNHAGIVVEDVVVTGSAGAGVYVHGASGFRLTDVTVSDTRADGIHMTGGSQDGVLERPVVNRSGDDGVAVVSYQDDAQVTRRISVEQPTVNGTTWGRGITVVGGEDIVYRGARVSDTSASGIYIATEGDPWFTYSVKRVSVLDAQVLRANQNEEVDHGAVLVSGAHQGTVVEDVTLDGVRIEDTRTSASRQVGLLASGGAVDDVHLRRVTVSGGGPVFHADTGSDSYVATGWVVGGESVDDPEQL